MNTNKIFRIFAKDLQTKKDKKFVGVVETVPPNNVITLTVPTLKKAFVFSAHDPMGVSPEGTDPLCVKFTGTLTDGTGPGEDQNFLFFFSTEIKVKAFIAEANKLIEAAKKGARGSTEKAVIRRNSLINSEGKLKTGKLLKRFTKAMSAVKVIRNDTVSQEVEPRAEDSVSDESEETSEEEETSESEGEEEVSLKEEKPSKENIPDPPASANLAEPAAETPQSVAQEDSEDDESDDHQQAPVPPLPAQTQGKTKSEDQTRKESMDHFLAAASVMVDAERGAKKASPTTEPTMTRAAPISSNKAKQSPSLDSQISEEGSRSSSPQRYRTSSMGNRDVTAPSFIDYFDETGPENAPDDGSARAARTPSLGNVDSTRPAFYEVEATEDQGPGEEDEAEEAASESPGTSEEESNFQQFLFVEKPPETETAEETQVPPEPESTEETRVGELKESKSIELPDTFVMEESEDTGGDETSTEEDNSPPPLRLNRSNKRPSALRHSFIATSAFVESYIRNKSGSRDQKSDSMITNTGSRSIFFKPKALPRTMETHPEEEASPSQAVDQEDAAGPEVSTVNAAAPSSFQLPREPQPEAEEEAMADSSAAEPPPLPSPTKTNERSRKAKARVERLRNSVIEGLNRAAKQDKIETSYVSGVENLLKMQQDRIKELEHLEREHSHVSHAPPPPASDRNLDRLLHQRDLEYQEKIDRLIQQQNKKELAMQENLAQEMHEMRRDYEKKVARLERQLKSDEGDRLTQIREEYDRMRQTMQDGFSRSMEGRERQIRSDEARKRDQMKEEYETKFEDQLSMKLEYENKIGKLEADEKEKLREMQLQHEAALAARTKTSDQSEKRFKLLQNGYEEKIKKLETKYQSLSKTFQALKNHELNLQNKQVAKEAQEEIQKLHTILSLMWNMLSTVDNEIAHYESLELPKFDWDRALISTGLDSQRKGAGKVPPQVPSILGRIPGQDPPPLITNK